MPTNAKHSHLSGVTVITTSLHTSLDKGALESSLTGDHRVNVVGSEVKATVGPGDRSEPATRAAPAVTR